jgi:hypothetical protein
MAPKRSMAWRVTLGLAPVPAMRQGCRSASVRAVRVASGWPARQSRPVGSSTSLRTTRSPLAWGHGAQVHDQGVELALAQGLQVLVLCGAGQAQLHATGVVAGKVQQWAGQQGCRGGAQPQAHLAGVAAHLVLHHLVQLVHLRHHLAGVLQHRAARGGEGVAVADAFDQGHAQLGLQLGNAAAEGGL